MLWNNLPTSSREPTSRAKFKKLIESYLTADSENWLHNALFYFFVLNYLKVYLHLDCVQMLIVS